MTDKLSYLASVSETRKVLERHGLYTKKSFGQHFLINDGVVSKICSLAQVCEEDNVVEVGPGIGTLTVALLSLAGSVTSIEFDPDLPAVLAETCADYDDKFTLIQNDALATSPDDLPVAPNKLVANLPYAVAATIVLDYFERFESIQSQTVMVQAEVADRMAAKVGTKDYGGYTAKLALYATPTGRFGVSEGNFFPPPRVKSAVIRLDRNSSALPVEVRQAATEVINAAFSARRKTISNSMKNYFASSPNSICAGKDKGGIASFVEDVLAGAGIDGSRRAETLEPGAYIELGKSYLRAATC